MEKDDKEVIDAGPDQSQEANASPPGVIILRQPGQSEGSIHLEIQEIGGLDPLAVPTLLRAAAKVKEQTLGV